MRQGTTRRRFIQGMASSGLLLAVGNRSVAKAADDAARPNVLWLTVEDSSYYEYGCYGQRDGKTPNIDRLASRGVRYTRCWSTAPQCSPARSSIITGCYATTYGMDEHRKRVPTPDGIFFPRLLRDAGYYCTNNSKTDYNTRRNHDAFWDANSKEATYQSPGRAAGQPFFAVFNNGRSHMSSVRGNRVRNRQRLLEAGLDPETLDLPPHVPDLPEVRGDHAVHLRAVQDIDAWVGEQLAALEAAGEADDTIVFFYSDHGGCLPRGKGFPHDTGLHSPLVVAAPPRWQHLLPSAPGSSDDRLVGFIDLAPTMLALAGVDAPRHMHGGAFLGSEVRPGPAYQFGFVTNQKYHFTPSRVASDGRFKYIRNYLPHRIYQLRNHYQWAMPANLAWDEAALNGRLDEPAWLQPYRPQPGETLFDLEADPWELNNLAGDPARAAKLAELRDALAAHLRDTRDLGLFPMSMRDRDGEPLYDWVRRTQYPLDALFEAAERASVAEARDVAALTALLTSPRPELSYWAAAGLALLASRGQLAEPPAELVSLLDHPNAEVAAMAGEALCLAGADDRALPRLVAMLEPPRSREAAASTLEVLSWFPALHERLVPLAPQIAAAGDNDFAIRSVLVNLGHLPVAELYPEGDSGGEG